MAKLRVTLAERLWAKVKIGREDECWPWQGALSRKGYGLIRFEGTLLQTHQVAIIVSHRPRPPAPNNQCLHSPECITRACCNPSHLRWGSHSDNMNDRNAAGTVCRGSKKWSAKLTESDVIKIRESTESNKTIALAYGMSPITILQIKNRRLWKHVP